MTPTPTPPPVNEPVLSVADAQRWAIAPFRGEKARVDPHRAAARVARVCRWRFPRHGGSCELTGNGPNDAPRLWRWTAMHASSAKREAGTQRSVPIGFGGMNFGQLNIDGSNGEVQEFLHVLGAALGLLIARHRADATVGGRGRRFVLDRRTVHDINNHLNTLTMQVEVARMLAEREETAECLKFLRSAERECAVLVDDWTTCCHGTDARRRDG